MNEQINWEKVGGLLPVIAQEHKTKDVLMLAFMNKKAFELTVQTGIAHYYSRTKQRIWKKGETSGNTQEIKSIFLDCDNDTLLIYVKQNGDVACHTGKRSCFFKQIDTKKTIKKPQEIDTSDIYGITDTLYHMIQERKHKDPKNSYVAKLLQGKENSMLKKIAEEASELCFAIKDKNKEEIVYEAADLLFHSLVALGKEDIHPDLIKQELKRRFGKSGIEEKKSRNVN